MSRISRLRSITLTLSRLSRLFCCAGLSSSSATRTSKPVSDFACASSSALPLPTYQLGSTWRRFCHSAPTTSAPAVVARAASSVRLSSADQPSSAPVSTATRKAFSTGGARSMVSRGLMAVTGYRWPSRHRCARCTPADAGPDVRRATRRRSEPGGRGRVGSAGASRTSRVGSRRNHVRWRRANWALRRASSSIASSRVQLAVDLRPSSRDSRWPRTPAGRGRTAPGGRAPPRSSPASNWARARAAMRRRCSAGSRASWRPRTGDG